MKEAGDRKKKKANLLLWTQQAGPGRLNLLLANPAVLIPRRNQPLIRCCHATRVVINSRGAPAPAGVRGMPRRRRARRRRPPGGLPRPPPGSGGG